MADPGKGTDVAEGTEVVRYTYRLRPGVQATATLEAEWGRCRWLWNEAVHQERSGNTPTRCKLGKLLTETRSLCAWLSDGSQNVQATILVKYAHELDLSFKVKGRRKPKFKSRKKTRPSLPYTRNGFSLRDGRLVLAKCHPIPVVWHRDLPSEPTSVRVYRDAVGHWWASFVVRREVEPSLETTGSIGIDWGVTTTATTTDPAYDLPFAGHARSAADKLAHYQRRMARRAPKPGQAGSKGYRRAKRDTAKLHGHVANQRRHTAQVWARRVVADHQLIAVEDFKPRFLARSTMARKSADAAIGAAKTELLYRAKRGGRVVYLVPPAYTTMTCSNCGARAKHRLGLAQRTFRCEGCGFAACRDRNAARVILDRAECDPGGADDVRHAAGLSAGGVRSEPQSLVLRAGWHYPIISNSAAL